MPRETTKTEKHTLIEQGTEFKGSMKSTCPVVVHGRIEGELTAPELDVTATGNVKGTIKAERLSSRGTLSGNVDAGDLFLSGSIGSKTVIKAKNLEVRLAPEQGRMELTIGECTLDVGDEPTKERRTEISTRPAADEALAMPVEAAPAKEEALQTSGALSDAEGKLGTKEGEGGKASRSGATALGNSKPPASKKSASDSIPPGAL